MQTEIIDVMRTQVRAIHRAVTGDELPDLEATIQLAEDASPESDDDILRKFFELDAVMRMLPEVAARVPPFSFTPPLDVIESNGGLILELALPGIAQGDVSVEQGPGGLVVTGIRRDEHAAERRTHAEIPRGPFRRAIPLANPIDGKPRTDFHCGVLRIHLAFSAANPATQDRSSTTGDQGNDDDGHE